MAIVVAYDDKVRHYDVWKNFHPGKWSASSWLRPIARCHRWRVLAP
jgi:hypothetical protein